MTLEPNTCLRCSGKMEGHRGTREDCTIIEVDDKVSKSDIDKEFLKELEEGEPVTKPSSSGERYNDIKIGWLPQILQKDYRNYVDQYCYPKELPIGPVYYEHKNETQSGDQRPKDKYESCVEKFHAKRDLKVKLARKLIPSIPGKGETLLNAIKKHIKELRTSIHDCTIDDDVLARFLFLDGCAIVQFIRSYYQNELEEFGIDNKQAISIQEDLFLLQNQIPFRVIVLLLHCMPTVTSSKLKEDIVYFLHINNIMKKDSLTSRYIRKQSDIIFDKENKNLHLLNHLHSLIKSKGKMVHGHKTQYRCLQCLGKCFKYCLSCLHKTQYHSLRCFDKWFKYCLFCLQKIQSSCLRCFGKWCKYCLFCFCCLLGCCRFEVTCLPSWRSRPRPRPIPVPFFNTKRNFRSAQELKSAGIEFKPSGADIAYSSKCFNFKGHLKIPPLTVDEWTKSKLMNLVAYEMCLGDVSSYIVTSYVKLMDFLIDKEEDVKELRASRVLWNHLSCDKDVVDLFNDMGSECFKPPKDYYFDVMEEMENHCQRKCAIWMAQVYQTHFRSPWTMVALSAAIIALLLTAIQTWYAINPNK
ncbi:uncharacterized protein LOC133783178 [Humulus lupulus]|uniref:uncharacterized protein LOC133783178 n=1 Tax=Humulus lupulus TaxID=3486 RepID=UPI002B4055FD|nr:uncharacterized protein LOC133783178 [Humulus lupulus]XP_062078707.1 uncharacterized protein LOC133783178 [Humulus lupulus]XP_062078708.1 uncharacterized protein LOC133783178 [Humulus lupulus]